MIRIRDVEDFDVRLGYSGGGGGRQLGASRRDQANITLVDTVLFGGKCV